MNCCHNNTHHKAPGEHAHAGHHAHHESHGGYGMGHGSAVGYLRRFGLVTVLLIPLVATNPSVAGMLGIPVLTIAPWLQLGIATVIFGFALVFFEHAGHEIRARQYGMMTLVSIAVGAGYAFSVAATFLPSLGMQFYLEISTLIWVLLFGHYLEARSSNAAGDVLAEAAKLLPKQAHKVVNGAETDVDIGTLAEGDTVLVRTGEKVPADGAVLEGSSAVDESSVTGESKPVEKQKGSEVSAGTLVLDGALTLRVLRVGEHSAVGQIQALIKAAQATKPRQARIADAAAGVLTFVALGAAIAAFLVWAFVLGQPIAFSLTIAITVLVVACPHALGLAIPTVTTIATRLAVKSGAFVKNLAKLETLRSADFVVFDKTGTLTKGTFGVTAVEAFGGAREDEVLHVAASLGQRSAHIIDRAVVAYAQEKGVAPASVEEFRSVAGRGVRGQVDGVLCLVGNRAFLEESGISIADTDAALARCEKEGASVVLVARGQALIGTIALADEIKPEAKQAIERLHALGVKAALLTGDNRAVAESVAHTLNIDLCFSEVLPHDKYSYVKKLQEEGHTVLMVGDGVNDAPALTQADVGIAIGAGTDLAVEAGDVVLMKNDPSDVARLVVLARAVYRKMLQNLAWALGYNVIAIPAAAGVFALWGVFLRPEVGALLMSASTVIVVINATSLLRLRLD